MKTTLPIQPRSTPESNTSYYKRYFARIEEIRKGVLNLAFFAGALLVGFTALKVLTTNNMIVEPIGLPKIAKDLGYTEDLVAMQFVDNMRNIEKVADVDAATLKVSSQNEIIDVAVPVDGVTFGSVIRFIRQAMGWPQPRLKADFVCKQDPCTLNTLELRARMIDADGATTVFPAITGASPDDILAKSAEYYTDQTNPFVLGMYLKNIPERRAEALPIFDQVIATNEALRPHAYTMKALYYFAPDNPSAEELKLAKENIEQSLAIAPNAAYLPLLAEIQVLQGDTQGGFANFRESLRLDPKQKDVAFVFGKYMMSQKFMTSKTAEEAHKIFEAALIHAPQDVSLLYGAGWSALIAGDAEKAVQLLENARAVDGTVAETYFRLGHSYAKLAQHDKARTAFETYLKLAPNGEFVASTQQALAELSAQ